FCSEDEERLVRDLFRGYNKLIRPVQNMTEKVHVRFGLAFVQLINVNEKNQIMKSNVWLRFVWTDYQLQWDEADYGGIGVLRLPPDKVWKPDIVLFNNADGNYEVRYKSNVLIYPNGEVLWVPPAIYQSSCTIDVTYFPFDQQTCIMKFGSWTFNGDQVSLALYNDKNFVDLSDYWKSGTWDIISVPAYLNTYQGDFPTETDITFYIIIRRKTLFYTVNLILPTVLISFLCVLVFYLPAEAGEKVTLGISILLSLVVFLLLVSKILPPTSLVLPLIAKYLLFTFIMNTVSILVTVIIINWNFRGPRTHRMPQMIRKIFLKYLPMMLMMRRPKKTRLRWMMEIPNVTLPTSTYSGSPTENLPGGMTKAKMEIMELSDLHHPNCKINRKAHHTGTSSTAASGAGTGTAGAAGGNNESGADRRGSESSESVLLSPEATKATEASEMVRFVYFIFTSGSENLTLGEEYTGITQASIKNRKIVPIHARVLCLLLELFGERELLKIVDRLKQSAAGSDDLNHKNAWLNILKLARVFIPVAVVFQKCLFYLMNSRFSISRQIAGIDYAKVFGMSPTGDVSWGLKFLGIITLIQCVLQIRQTGFNKAHDDQDYAGQPASSIDNENVANCQLCFEAQPSAVTPCGHLFCWNCLAEWARVQSQCPACREYLTSSRIVPLINL
ncbi:hypothetical protein G9C98_000129, partial [Cotesia typhae]